MSNVVIKVENLSKKYRLGTIGTGTISHDLNRFWAKLRGNEDPYLKVGEANDRSKKGVSDYVWALQDINFEVRRGEVLGIIGRNGAGKSTLLKILSRITKPTTGSVKMKGRVGSLLEVGTGFHSDLTGRENIYINGAILGMRKWEIDKKLDEIIDFAGIERYIDTPVKRYSSGMVVRLGFAVAAHLEPEILIVDEVLAVGDAEFQKKCLGKMGEVSRQDGRAILFVSHSMGAVQTLCPRVIVMNQGRLSFDGNVEAGLLHYFESKDFQRRENLDDHREMKNLSRMIEFQYLYFVNSKDIYNFNEELRIKIRLNTKERVKKFRLSFSIKSRVNDTIGSGFMDHETIWDEQNSTNLEVTLKDLQLPQGFYYFSFAVGVGDNDGISTIYDVVSEVLEFEVRPRVNTYGVIARWMPGWGNINFNHISVRDI